MTHDVSVSGLSCTIPNGAVAPGKVCPSPPVPIIGSTASYGAGGGVVWAASGVATNAARKSIFMADIKQIP